MDLLAFILAISAEGITDEQVQTALNAYIAEHPEAVTTVADGSITKAKLDNNLKETVDDVGELKSAVNDLPFSEDIEEITLNWELTNKYRISDGTYIDKSWAYDSTVSVSPGEKYYITGYSYYEMCIYYIEDSNGDIIAEQHYSGTNTLHENMEVVIPANGVALVMQINNADGRESSKLKKYVGMILDDGTVGYDNLTNDLQSNFPSSSFVNGQLIDKL